MPVPSTQEVPVLINTADIALQKDDQVSLGSLGNDEAEKICSRTGKAQLRSIREVGGEPLEGSGFENEPPAACPLSSANTLSGPNSARI
jgi:hypothetical protein